jgi:hypothetical protein
VLVEPIDERDSSWEESDLRYRVYFFAGPPPGRSVDTYDVTKADVLDVIRWAQDHAGDDRLFAVALVGQNAHGRRGLSWLVGCDANGAASEALEKMIDRRGRTVVI